MLSPYARKEWLTICAIGVLLLIAAVVAGWWIAAAIVVIATIALLLFFRDPARRTPSQRGVVVSPADGRISSIHRLDHFEPLGGPALCIRVFLSVLDVHVNRSPCHGRVTKVTHKPGQHLNALNPRSAEDNESVLITLAHPVKDHPVAAVRLIAGLLARTVHCGVKIDDTLQRGQKIGIIKLGSTAELYLPLTLAPEPAVEQGQKVKGGLTVLANVTTTDPADPAKREPTTAYAP